jgi:hypothetical protein
MQPWGRLLGRKESMLHGATPLKVSQRSATKRNSSMKFKPSTYGKLISAETRERSNAMMTRSTRIIIEEIIAHFNKISRQFKGAGLNV